MPSYIFNDTLQTYPPGPGFPANFHGLGIVFLSQFSSPPSPTPAPGYYERTGIIYELFGTIAFPLDADLALYPTNATTVCWATLSNNGAPGTVQLFSTDPANPTTGSQPLATVVFEPDASVSIAVPGAAKINSLIPIFPYDTWEFFQLTASFGSILIGTDVFVTVNCYLAVNGTVLISNAIFVTNVLVSGLWNAAPSVNQWVFTGPANGQFFGEFAATQTIETLPFFPNPGTPLASHNSQMVVELMEQFSPNARMTQGVVELVTQYTPNARVTQMVVELIVSNTAGGGFPEYIKRHQAPGH